MNTLKGNVPVSLSNTLLLCIISLLVFLSGCNVSATPTVVVPTDTLRISTATLSPPTDEPAATVLLQPSTPQPTMEIIPTDTIQASPSPTQIPTPANLPLLPAPLLYLADTDGVPQIWRMEADGGSQAQITMEKTGVIDYDVSPADGRLVYISDNDLIVADANGKNRTLLVDGPLPPAENDAQRPLFEIGRPRWSADGASIAYALGGVNVVASSGGKPRKLIKSDPLPAPPDFKTNGAVRIYWPEAWSPDSSQLLIGYGVWPEGSGLGTIDPTSGKLSLFKSDRNITCCYPVWSLDNSSVFYANPFVGMIPPGFWMADASTGKTTTLLESDPNKGPFHLAGFVHPIGEDMVNFFYSKSDAAPEGMVKLNPVQASVRSMEDIIPLRSGSWLIGEALWTPDGSGVVVLDLSTQSSSQPLGKLIYLPMGEAKPVPLPVSGNLLKWGR